MALFEPLFDALNGAGIRYVVVGGVATVLHGHARLTADVDLVIDLSPAEARRTVEVLTGLGLRPRAPVDPLEFADAAVRRRWVEDKGMRVFSLYDPSNPMLEVDLFADLPIAFEQLWERAEMVALGRGRVRIASLDDVIRMKRLAGRPQDLADVEALELVRRRREAGDVS
jgi:hypothetical protein